MSFQSNVKGHIFQKQARRPLIFKFYLDFLSLDDSACMQEIYNFNYTHTSLIVINVSIMTT